MTTFHLSSNTLWTYRNSDDEMGPNLRIWEKTIYPAKQLNPVAPWASSMNNLFKDLLEDSHEDRDLVPIEYQTLFPSVKPIIKGIDPKKELLLCSQAIAKAGYTTKTEIAEDKKSIHITIYCQTASFYKSNVQNKQPQAS
jgi:hypothetical protein